jgi:hypothetical protein
MRIIIRAVRDRAPYIDYLTERLPAAEWCFDQKRNAMDTFLRALDMAGNGPVVHMEDDTVLSEGFLPALRAAIAERPDQLKALLDTSDKFRALANDAGDFFTRLNDLVTTNQE